MRSLALALLMTSSASAALAQSATPYVDPADPALYASRLPQPGLESTVPVSVTDLTGPAMPTDLSPEGVRAADDFLWLEEVNGERAMDWVRGENQRAQAALEGDPRYETFRQQAYDILSATDRIAYPHMQGGMVFNFWQDDTHPKGIWRRATPESYASGNPEWETVLDIDSLARSEGRDWVWKGATCYGPDETMCLIALSDGGGDAVVVREFDTMETTFVSPVSAGLDLPMGKHRYDWLDENTLLVATDFGEVDAHSSLTESGYPYIVRALRRGQTLAEAETVFAGQPGDGGYGVSPTVYRGPDGAVEAVIISRPLDTFRSETWALIDGETTRLILPERVTIWGMLGSDLVFSVEEDWQIRGLAFAAGSLTALPLLALDSSPPQNEETHVRAVIITNTPLTIFSPSARQSIESVVITRSGLVVSGYDNVVGRLQYFSRQRIGRHMTWTAREIALPDNSAITLVDGGRGSDQVFYSVEGFLTPTTLYVANLSTGENEVVAELPARFDASTHVVEQFEATSTDGTLIPYFIVRPRDLAMDGQAPTILFGYGGFNLSKPADYIPEMGRLWLSNGGVFVNANIRGGGEFGPGWHQAALRENRQRSFDDFAAVAQDLITRGITSPEHLGIYGRSNGGVLTSVSVTQRPGLFNAAVIESPLVDMLRYQELPAGASWIGEYGDPRIPADAAFIAQYSAYQHVRADQGIPRVYITTNTHDDRVHPGHARKFAARLEQYGYSPIYFEDTAGGHSYDADPAANARRWARHYVYFSQQLMD